MIHSLLISWCSYRDSYCTLRRYSTDAPLHRMRSINYMTSISKWWHTSVQFRNPVLGSGMWYVPHSIAVSSAGREPKKIKQTKKKEKKRRTTRGVDCLFRLFCCRFGDRYNKQMSRPRAITHTHDNTDARPDAFKQTVFILSGPRQLLSPRSVLFPLIYYNFSIHFYQPLHVNGCDTVNWNPARTKRQKDPTSPSSVFCNDWWLAFKVHGNYPFTSYDWTIIRVICKKKKLWNSLKFDF